MDKKSIWESYRFPLILIGAIIVGTIIGIYMGPKAKMFKPLGDIFINGMFTIVVPLVFVTISSSISSMSNLKRLGNILKSLFFTFITTGLIASLIIIFVVKVFPPAQGVQLNLSSVGSLEPFKTSEQVVKALTVTDFPELISRKNMLPLIIFSIFFGFCINLVGEKGEIISKGLDALAEVFLKMIGILMYYAPVGLGA